MSNVRRRKTLLMKALRFPSHFPPTDRWKKFFVGIRWLGPDLSIFKEMKSQQGRRTPQDMGKWGGGKRQQVAEAISRALVRQLGWKSEVFLPEDSAAVAFHGPRFDFSDPESAFEEVLEILDRDFGLKEPAALWAKHAESTLGEVVDGLLFNSDA